MKEFVQATSAKKILRTHPIASGVEGWFIRIAEESSGNFFVEARDVMGRLVSKRGTDPDTLKLEIEETLEREFRNL